MKTLIGCFQKSDFFIIFTRNAQLRMEIPPKDTTALPTDLTQAQFFVRKAFGRRQDGRLLVNNYALAVETAQLAGELAEAEGLDPSQRTAAQLAGLFTTVGYVYDYQQPAEYSRELLQQYLGQQDGDIEQPALALSALEATLDQQPPQDIVGEVAQDARSVVMYLTNTEERQAQLQLERELISGQRMEKPQATRYFLDELLRVQLYTHAAQARYQPVLAQAIHQYRATVHKQEEKAAIATGRFTELEKKAPVRGVQTYFRTNYRNHINLSAIADNKANIMIGINAILISVLITFLSYRNIGETQPAVLLPIVIFLTTGLASLIFAVLSVRPKITMLHPKGTELAEVRRNITFFGNFVHLSLEEYESAMEQVFNDGPLLYGNMVRDLYYLGKVLERKYRFLTISYNIFMVGFAATVISFLIVSLTA